MPDRSKSITANFDEIEQAFVIWNAQARDGNWEQRDDPEAAAEHFMQLVVEIQEGAH